MSDSEDSYGGYDFSELTEEDLTRIDLSVIEANLKRNEAAPDAAPSLEVAIEGAVEPSAVTPPTVFHPYDDSPIRRYRKTGILSVTDLVSPSWCEVQFNYGLQQRRHLRPENRPKTFTTDSGKVITVKQETVQENFQITSKGKAVHKALEREVKPDMVVVTPTTDEERWALRLINMMDGFESLRLFGIAREVPVFGIIQDQIIIGVIDELLRKPAPAMERATSPSKRPSEYGQRSPRKKQRTPKLEPAPQQLSLITNFYASAKPQPNPLPHEPSPHLLYILDTKTRNTDSLPPHEDTLSSRLQLMLYHRLLSGILPSSSLGVFDFNALWTKLRLNPTKSFSARFMRQAGLNTEIEGVTPINCLDNLVQAWFQPAFDLEVEGVASTLELIYRTQPQRKSRWKRTRSERCGDVTLSPCKDSGDNLQDLEAMHLEQAILASLSHLKHKEQDASATSERADRTSQGRPQPDGRSAQGDDKPQETTLTTLKSVAPSSPGPTRHVETSTLRRATTMPVIASGSEVPSDDALDQVRIIGTKQFNVDDKMLDDYVGSILKWWYGHRDPAGVSESEANRCSSCEYCNGCEWRESKAASKSRTSRLTQLIREASLASDRTK
ncbi:hypothetical protein ONZ45_g4210 [Pleurotus djamor]|nr:hypothetical protein ONZ45_g4210 [Pleurotus djamor]